MTITNIIGSLLVPPGLVFLCLLSALFGWQRQKLARNLTLISTMLLYLFSTSFGAYILSKPLLHYPPLILNRLSTYKGVGAIVILGGGRHAEAPEYGGDTVSADTLIRLRYGARLQRLTGLPVLVSGGAVHGENITEAKLMADALEHDFHVPTKWQEVRSRNTYENAKYSAEILKQAKIKRVFLVTQSIHMPRSVAVFRKRGIAVVAAPTQFSAIAHLGARQFLPMAGAMYLSAMAMHEYWGRVWYLLRYGVGF